MSEATISTAAATSTAISSEPVPVKHHPNDVWFKIKYPKDYKGPKEMPEGKVIVVSKETADHFKKVGIGAIVAKPTDEVVEEPVKSAEFDPGKTE